MIRARPGGLRALLIVRVQGGNPAVTLALLQALAGVGLPLQARPGPAPALGGSPDELPDAFDGLLDGQAPKSGRGFFFFLPPAAFGSAVSRIVSSFSKHWERVEDRGGRKEIVGSFTYARQSPLRPDPGLVVCRDSLRPWATCAW